MIEEIKLIAEVLEGLSGTALHAFIVYLIAGRLLPLIICWSGGITLACIVFKRGSTLIFGCSNSVEIVKQLRTGLGIGSAGSLYEREIDEVRTILPEVIKAYKEKQN